MTARPDYPALALLIDGEWVAGGGRVTEAIVDPANEEIIGQLPHATAADIDRALAAAERAGRDWATVSAYDRAKILRRAADLLRERVETIATWLTLEEGKILAEARAEVLTAADIFEWNAEEGRRAYGRIVPSRTAGQRNLVLKEPIGVVAALAPWNFPAATAARKIAASLAAGCACIAKPAEETPATALALGKALVDAGLPNGVLNILFGVPSEVSERLLRSPIIRKVSFTGSTAVGIQLATLAAADVKRTTLELGGHAPVVIFDDADVDQAVELALAAKYRNAGQICVSPTRFFVQQPVFDRFLSRFAAGSDALAVGSGLQPDSRMGPLANARRLAAMEVLIADAVAEGAQLKAGGTRIGNRGYFWRPTVLANVPDSARLMTEEPFGPIAIVNSFETIDEALAKANRLRFGLSAYAFTRSAERARRVSDGLRAGVVGLNTFTVTLTEIPFGGIDHSGDGREGGIEGLESYLATKTVAHLS